MRKKIILLSLFIFISCFQKTDSLDEKNIQEKITNRDHVIVLDDKFCYAVFKNLWEYEFYVFNNQSILIENQILRFITNAKREKISIGMKSKDVVKLLGEPAIKIKNKYLYFQVYLDIQIFKIYYGIDRRVFEIIFDDDEVKSFREVYVSRA